MLLVYVIQVCRQLSSRSICFWYMSYRFVDIFQAGAYAPGKEHILLVYVIQVCRQLSSSSICSWYMSYRFVDSFQAAAYASGICHTGL